MLQRPLTVTTPYSSTAETPTLIPHHNRDPISSPQEGSGDPPLFHHPIQGKFPPPSPGLQRPPTFTALYFGDPQIQERPHLHPPGHQSPPPCPCFCCPSAGAAPVLGLPEAPGVGTDPTEPPGTAQPWGGFHPLPPAQALNEQSARNDGFILEINLNPKPWELLGEPNISCRHCIHEEGGQGGSGAQIVPSCHSPGPVWGGWCPTFWTLLPVGQEEQSRTHGKGDSRGAFHHFCWF